MCFNCCSMGNLKSRKSSPRCTARAPCRLEQNAFDDLRRKARQGIQAECPALLDPLLLRDARAAKPRGPDGGHSEPPGPELHAASGDGRGEVT